MTEDEHELDVLKEECAERASAMLLDSIAPDVDLDTPGRMARALIELTDGYDADPKAILKSFEAPRDSGIVVVRDIPFASLCEHHVLPFMGKAAVAYLPSTRVVGLSKVPRLVRAVSHRLQMQERIGQQVADALARYLKARGVLVVLRAQHTCMSIRGACAPGETVTSCARGVFRKDAAARAEALHLIGD